MAGKLQFDFLVDRKTIRSLSKLNSLVTGNGYGIVTLSELLDQCFAPKSFTTRTKSMDFTEGGHLWNGRCGWK